MHACLVLCVPNSKLLVSPLWKVCVAGVSHVPPLVLSVWGHGRKCSKERRLDLDLSYPREDCQRQTLQHRLDHSYRFRCLLASKWSILRADWSGHRVLCSCFCEGVDDLERTAFDPPMAIPHATSGERLCVLPLVAV